MKEHLHFVGIGGIGMSGIAEVFLNQGYKISGSDIAEGESTRKLASLGATIHIGHQGSNVVGANVVVISSAIRPTNPEVLEAKRLRIPVIPRAEMLAEIMRGKTAVAVAGTHGKTTTTSMVATVFTEAGLDPTLVIGGKVDSLGGNAKLGQGQLVIAEADESDGSFLQLPATVGIVTNIDNDHLDHYGSIEAIENAFIQFVDKLPFYGLAAICGDDPRIRKCAAQFIKPFLTYGFSKECDLYADEIHTDAFTQSFEVHFKGASLGRFTLQVPGRHNVLNALATLLVAQYFKISFDQIREGLKAYRGVKRRFEIKYQNLKTQRLIVDDYGHHPTEIAATLAAARSSWPATRGRIITIFQPHRYSRTLHCKEGFLSAFKDTDVLLMTDIYAAGEDPIEGVSSEGLIQNLRKSASSNQTFTFVGDLKKAKETALSQWKDGDLILCMGAGSITRLAEELAQEAVKR